MAKTKVTSTAKSTRPMRPALTPEAKENQMISLAMDLAEQQLRDGTASSQLITHFLKLATERERLERVRLEKENELLIAKTEQIQSQKNSEDLYNAAIKAMRRYNGQGGYDDEEEDY